MTAVARYAWRMTLPVRAALAADADAIARVHVDSWRAAYEGILPPAMLSALDRRALVARWRHRIEAGAPVWVADRAGQVSGFATADRDVTDPALADLAGELTMLYVHPYDAGAGVGSALLANVERRLAARPLYWLVVWVVERNFDARSFYTARGLRPDGARRIDRFLDRSVDVVRYGKPLNPAIDYERWLARGRRGRINRPMR